jgi:hypothetical protein
MRTLHLRNVPEDVLERLERLAAAESMSVSALVVRELADVSRRVDNSRLLDNLPDLAIETSVVVGSSDDARGEHVP